MKELFKQALKETVSKGKGIYYFVGYLTESLGLTKDKETSELLDQVIWNEVNDQ